MDEQQSTDETTLESQQADTAQDQTASDQAAEARFTAADVERIVRERLARAERRQVSTVEAPRKAERTANKAATPSHAEYVAELNDVLDDLADVEGFKVPFRAEGKRLMRERYAADRAAGLVNDPNAWVKGFAEMFGHGQKAPTPPPATNNAQQSDKQGKPAAPTRTGPPISDKGAAVAAVKDANTLLAGNPQEWTKHDIDRIYAHHGPEKGAALMAETVQRWMQTVKLVPDRRR